MFFKNALHKEELSFGMVTCTRSCSNRQSLRDWSIACKKRAQSGVPSGGLKYRLKTLGVMVRFIVSYDCFYIHKPKLPF